MASAASSVAFSGRNTVWLHSATGVERGREIDLLKCSGPDHLCLHLAGQCDHRDPVDLGIPQPSEQVGRAGSGDGQTGGGLARVFAYPAAANAAAPSWRIPI